jgi:hypothetical protein
MGFISSTFFLTPLKVVIEKQTHSHQFSLGHGKKTHSKKKRGKSSNSNTKPIIQNFKHTMNLNISTPWEGLKGDRISCIHFRCLSLSIAKKK